MTMSNAPLAAAVVIVFPPELVAAPLVSPVRPKGMTEVLSTLVVSSVP
jgi:hypothetical protein